MYRASVARVSRRRTVRLIACAGILGLLNGVVPVAPVSAASDKLPDLRVARVTDFTIQRTSSGRRLLRFSGMMVNVGRGPFEVRSRRASTKKPWIVEQVIYRTGGGSRRVRTTATMKYAGDGHDHWHVRKMLSFHLWSTKGTEHAAKIGFCFFDTNRHDGSLPGAPKSRKYTELGCGHRGSLHTKTGISVGWADLYPRNFAYQWIDITGVPGGTYTVRGAVDLYGRFLESSETNNCTWSTISFKSSGSKVKVLATGSKCLNDHDTSPYAADIDWAVAENVARNCDADMFCTYDTVTRAELASFMTRVMHLPAVDTDYFTDDKGTGHEAAINRVAAAGILTGCAPTRFCPDQRVTRSLLAVVIARALALTPVETDYFTDDDGTAREARINEVAEAGLMTGCTPSTFCPTVTIRRGQVMRVLRKAFGTPPPAEGSLDVPQPGSLAMADPSVLRPRMTSVSLASSLVSSVGLEDPADWIAVPGGASVGSATPRAPTEDEVPDRASAGWDLT